MTTLRARYDLIIVREVDGKAVQYEYCTTLRDQLELSKRFPKAAEDPGSAPVKLAYLAAQRLELIPTEETFDEFVDLCLDWQLEDAPPLVKG